MKYFSLLLALFLTISPANAGVLAKLIHSHKTETYDNYLSPYGETRVSVNSHTDYIYEEIDTVAGEVQTKTVTLPYKIKHIRDVRPFIEKHPIIVKLYNVFTIGGSIVGTTMYLGKN